MDKRITISINSNLFNQLRITSIHQHQNVETIIEGLIEQHYNSRKKD